MEVATKSKNICRDIIDPATLKSLKWTNCVDSSDDLANISLVEKDIINQDILNNLKLSYGFSLLSSADLAKISEFVCK